MDSLFGLLSWRNAAIGAATYVVYFTLLMIYRVFFHPLSKFPGPKRAAATYLYEGYYDVIQNGQYTFKIAKLHKQYGPIIRINPNELHVLDPTFYKTIYRQDGIWNKDPFAYNAQPPSGSAIATVDHHQHKIRRSPYNGYFSKAKIAARQDVIHGHLNTLVHRIGEFADNNDDTKNRVFDLGLTASAFTRDIADQYILGQNHHNLQKEDFNKELTNMIQDVGYIWRMNKHLPSIHVPFLDVTVRFSDIMKAAPQRLVLAVADNGTRAFFGYFNGIREISDRLMREWKAEKENGSGGTIQKKGGQRTIIHEILDSNTLAPSDKKLDRIWDEVTTITGAGFETTASVLRTIYFHLWSDKDMLRRVREELRANNIPFEISELDFRQLEKLPFLTAVISEGLRLSPAIASRMGRVAPDREIIYVDRSSGNTMTGEGGTRGQGKQWVIPRGYTVGMTTLLMHLDEELYPNPTEFRPERWIEGHEGLNARRLAESNGTFAPFSRGTRICLGMYLAWAELYILLAALVQRFDFEFEGAKAEDFLCSSDQFIIGTSGGGVLKATATRVKT